MNKLELTGEVVQLELLRYTPAGIPLLSFAVAHQSEQIEADMKRKVECVVNVMAMGTLALQCSKLVSGSHVNLTGFLAKRSLKSTQLVMHLTTIEFI